jgi:hypothetical protein
VGTKNFGEFLIRAVVVLGEGTGDLVVRSSKLLAVFSYFVRQVMQCVETSHFKANRRLDWGFAVLDEIGFLEPSLQGCAVGHGDGAVTASEAAGNDIHPRCDDHRDVFKQVVMLRF